MTPVNFFLENILHHTPLSGHFAKILQTRNLEWCERQQKIFFKYDYLDQFQVLIKRIFDLGPKSEIIARKRFQSTKKGQNITLNDPTHFCISGLRQNIKNRFD